MSHLRHKPDKWHLDRSVLIYPYLGMLHIYQHYRKLGVVYARHQFFRRKWGTVPYNTKHHTLDDAIELILERDASGSQRVVDSVR